MGLRQVRLADEVRDLIGKCFYGGQLSDPGLEGVCITHVKLSGDLQLATVYYRIIDANRKDLVEKGLKRCRGLLRSRLAGHLRSRHVPELRFFYDESVEYGSRIENLLADWRRESSV